MSYISFYNTSSLIYQVTCSRKGPAQTMIRVAIIILVHLINRYSISNQATVSQISRHLAHTTAIQLTHKIRNLLRTHCLGSWLSDIRYLLSRHWSMLLPSSFVSPSYSLVADWQAKYVLFLLGGSHTTSTWLPLPEIASVSGGSGFDAAFFVGAWTSDVCPICLEDVLWLQPSAKSCLGYRAPLSSEL